MSSVRAFSPEARKAYLLKARDLAVTLAFYL